MPQIALNWLLQRPTVATVLIGARNEEQLRANLGAVGWNLTPEQIKKLDDASIQRPAYPSGISRDFRNATRSRYGRWSDARQPWYRTGKPAIDCTGTVQTVIRTLGEFEIDVPKCAMSTFLADALPAAVLFALVTTITPARTTRCCLPRA